jgi:ketosteroid isomerase-like protein
MSVAHAPSVHAHRPHVNPWLVAVIALSAALVALAAWVIVDNYTGGDTATKDATALIDDFNAASSANDAAAAKALMTNDTVLWSNGDVIKGADAWASAIAGTPGLIVERLSPVTVNGDYATTFARFAVTSLPGIDGPTIQVYQLENGKIARLWMFVPGMSQPLDNAKQ